MCVTLVGMNSAYTGSVWLLHVCILYPIDLHQWSDWSGVLIKTAGDVSRKADESVSTCTHTQFV